MTIRGVAPGEPAGGLFGRVDPPLQGQTAGGRRVAGEGVGATGMLCAFGTGGAITSSSKRTSAFVSVPDAMLRRFSAVIVGSRTM